MSQQDPQDRNIDNPREEEFRQPSNLPRNASENQLRTQLGPERFQRLKKRTAGQIDEKEENIRLDTDEKGKLRTKYTEDYQRRRVEESTLDRLRKQTDDDVKVDKSDVTVEKTSDGWAPGIAQEFIEERKQDQKQDLKQEYLSQIKPDLPSGVSVSEEAIKVSETDEGELEASLSSSAEQRMEEQREENLEQQYLSQVRDQLPSDLASNISAEDIVVEGTDEGKLQADLKKSTEKTLNQKIQQRQSQSRSGGGGGKSLSEQKQDLKQKYANQIQSDLPSGVSVSSEDISVSREGDRLKAALSSSAKSRIENQQKKELAEESERKSAKQLAASKLGVDTSEIELTETQDGKYEATGVVGTETETVSRDVTSEQINSLIYKYSSGEISKEEFKQRRQDLKTKTVEKKKTDSTTVSIDLGPSDISEEKVLKEGVTHEQINSLIYKYSSGEISKEEVKQRRSKLETTQLQISEEATEEIETQALDTQKQDVAEEYAENYEGVEAEEVEVYERNDRLHPEIEDEAGLTIEEIANSEQLVKDDGAWKVAEGTPAYKALQERGLISDMEEDGIQTGLMNIRIEEIGGETYIAGATADESDYTLRVLPSEYQTEDQKEEAQRIAEQTEDDPTLIGNTVSTRELEDKLEDSEAVQRRVDELQSEYPNIEAEDIDTSDFGVGGGITEDYRQEAFAGYRGEEAQQESFERRDFEPAEIQENVAQDINESLEGSPVEGQDVNVDPTLSGEVETELGQSGRQDIRQNLKQQVAASSDEISTSDVEVKPREQGGYQAELTEEARLREEAERLTAEAEKTIAESKNETAEISTEMRARENLRQQLEDRGIDVQAGDIQVRETEAKGDEEVRYQAELSEDAEKEVARGEIIQDLREKQGIIAGPEDVKLSKKEEGEGYQGKLKPGAKIETTDGETKIATGGRADIINTGNPNIKAADQATDRLQVPLLASSGAGFFSISTGGVKEKAANFYEDTVAHNVLTFDRGGEVSEKRNQTEAQTQSQTRTLPVMIPGFGGYVDVPVEQTSDLMTQKAVGAAQATAQTVVPFATGGSAILRGQPETAVAVAERAATADSLEEFQREDSSKVETEAEKFVGSALGTVAATGTKIPGTASEVVDAGEYVAREDISTEEKVETLGSQAALKGSLAARYAIKNPTKTAGSLVGGTVTGTAVSRAVGFPVRYGKTRLLRGVDNGDIETSTWRGIYAKNPVGADRPMIGVRTGGDVRASPVVGTPEIDLDGVKPVTGAEGVAADDIRGIEGRIYRNYVRSQGTEQDIKRFESAQQLSRLARDEPSTSGRTSYSAEKAIQESRQIPDDATEEVLKFMKEDDAMLGGSAAQLVQARKGRTPDDIDIYTDNPARAQDKLYSILKEKSDRPVRRGYAGGVEVKTDDGWEHQVDINRMERGVGGQKEWGGELYDPVRSKEGVKLQPLQSQLGAKIEGGVRAYEGGKVLPKVWRKKDVYDVADSAEGLIHQKKRSINPLTQYRARKAESALETWRRNYGEMDLPGGDVQGWADLESNFEPRDLPPQVRNRLIGGVQKGGRRARFELQRILADESAEARVPRLIRSDSDGLSMRKAETETDADTSTTRRGSSTTEDTDYGGSTRDYDDLSQNVDEAADSAVPIGAGGAQDSDTEEESVTSSTEETDEDYQYQTQPKPENRGSIKAQLLGRDSDYSSRSSEVETESQTYPPSGDGDVETAYGAQGGGGGDSEAVTGYEYSTDSRTAREYSGMTSGVTDYGGASGASGGGSYEGSASDLIGSYDTITKTQEGTSTYTGTGGYPGSEDVPGYDPPPTSSQPRPYGGGVPTENTPTYDVPGDGTPNGGTPTRDTTTTPDTDNDGGGFNLPGMGRESEPKTIEDEPTLDASWWYQTVETQARVGTGLGIMGSADEPTQNELEEYLGEGAERYANVDALPSAGFISGSAEVKDAIGGVLDTYGLEATGGDGEDDEEFFPTLF